MEIFIIAALVYPAYLITMAFIVIVESLHTANRGMSFKEQRKQTIEKSRTLRDHMGRKIPMWKIKLQSLRCKLYILGLVK